MKIFSIILLLMFINSCGVQESGSEPNIHGVWLLKNIQGLGYSTSHIAYTEDGKKCEISANYSFNGNLVTNYNLSSWQLNGDRLSTIVDKTTSKVLTGTNTIHVIHKLNEQELNILLEQKSDVDVTELEVHMRIGEEDPSAICLVVESAIRKHNLRNELDRARL